MNKSDQWVNMVLILAILLYMAVLAYGYYSHKLAYLSSIVNLITGGSIVLYWIMRQLQITQHIFEIREILVLLFEVFVIFCAVYYLASGQRNISLKVMQHIFFGIHFLVLVLGIIFLLTFKMPRLI